MITIMTLAINFWNKQVRHMFDEIDYILEAQNAERFASLYALTPSKFSYIFYFQAAIVNFFGWMLI